MTQEEKLKKIIEKAIPFTTDYWNGEVLKEISDVEIRGQYNLVYLQGGSFAKHINLYELIFSKQFLKAFFGEHSFTFMSLWGECEKCKSKKVRITCEFAEETIIPSNWQHKAQKLVLEDDKIDYLYKQI